MGSAERVAIYRSSLLPASETFIEAQALALRRWEPRLLGSERAPHGLSLDALPHEVAHQDPTSLLGRALRRADALVERRLGHSLALARLVARARPALVHAHFGTDGVRVWPAARALGLPLIVTLHGYDITIDEAVWRAHAGARERAYPDKLRALAREPSVRFIAVSEAIRQKAIAFGIPATKVEVLYIGVDVARFRPTGAPLAARAREVLFVGRLVEKKGAAHLLSAFARVKATLPDARLVIAGDGPLRPELEALAARERLDVRFLGSVDGATVARRLAEARAFCLPSVVARTGDGEGLGIALLEAQASGVPVVTSAQGGRDEAIVHGETGFAFAERDEEALAAYLVRLLADDALSTRLGARARRFVTARFDLAKCTEKLEELYDRAHAEGMQLAREAASAAQLFRPLAARLLGGEVATRGGSPNTR